MDSYKPKINKADFIAKIAPEEKIRFLLQYAILAPSTHNSQPWLFKVSTNSCKIYYDPEIKIKEADPEGRDKYISIGCMIENLVIAARYFNVFDRMDYRVNSADNLTAEILFNFGHPDAQKEIEPMLDAIVERVNVRGVFDKKPINEIARQKLTAIQPEKNIEVAFLTEKEKIAEMASLTATGLKQAYASSSFRQEMSGWINSNFSKKLQGIPGYAMRMPAILSLILPKLIRLFNIGKPLSILNYKSFSSVPLVCILSAAENNPETWLDIGRTGQRLMLKANALGLKTSIFVASVEVGELYKEVQKIIGTRNRPQFVFCMGYMNGPHRHTPRHPLESKLI